MACVFLCHLSVSSPFLFRPNVLSIKLVGQKPSLPVVEVYFIPPTGFYKGWI